jgi:hypothetical protein
MSLSNGLELAGMSSLTIAAWMVSPILGFAVGGVALIIVGLGLEKRSNSK